MNNILWIVQCRTTSSRLPGKVLKKIGDKTMFEHHISKVSEMGHHTVVGVPCSEPKIEELKEIANQYNVEVYNPHNAERDVLSRFVAIADRFEPEWIIRTTVDCWDMDTNWCARTISACIDSDMPIFNSYKEGSTIEMFKYMDLVRANDEIGFDEFDMQHRENVTSYFRKGFEKGSIDTREELENARQQR